MAIYKNLILEQGTNFSHIFTLTDSVTLVPRDFTGWTIDSKLKKSYGSSSATPFDVIFSNITNGEITISLKSYVSDILKPGKYVYDIEGINPSGNTERLIEGQINISPQVTTTSNKNSTIPSHGNLDLGTLALGGFDAFGVPVSTNVPTINLVQPLGQLIPVNLGILQ